MDKENVEKFLNDIAIGILTFIEGKVEENLVDEYTLDEIVFDAASEVIEANGCRIAYGEAFNSVTAIEGVLWRKYGVDCDGEEIGAVVVELELKGYYVSKDGEKIPVTEENKEQIAEKVAQEEGCKPKRISIDSSWIVVYADCGRKREKKLYREPKYEVVEYLYNYQVT